MKNGPDIVLNLSAPVTAPHQKYIRSCALHWTWNGDPDISLFAPHFYMGVTKSEIMLCLILLKFNKLVHYGTIMAYAE